MNAKSNITKVLSLIAVAFAFNACQENVEPFPENENERLVISNDAITLSERVVQKGETVEIHKVNSTLTMSAAQDGLNKGLETENFTLLAEIESPFINGEKSSASHVKIIGNKAYITYHLRGEEYGGGFDIIDLANPDNIMVSSAAVFKDSDFNALDIEESGSDGIVYLAGANGNGALIQKIKVENGYLTNQTDSIQLDGYNANGVAISKHQLYASVGGSAYSGFYALDIRNENKMWEINEFREANYAKDVALSSTDLNSDLVLLAGGPSASVLTGRIMSKGIGGVNNHPAGVMQTLDGKNSVVIDQGYIYTALSDIGLSVYHKDILGELYNIPSSEFGGGLTNGVSVDDEYLYIANGTSGVFLAKKPTSGSHELIGVLNMDGSANYVASNEGYLVVANGTGGVKILQKSKGENEISACRDGDNWNVDTSGSFTIKKNEVLVKAGSVSFKNDLTIHGELYNCGTVQVGTNLNIQNGGKMDVYGSIVANKDLSLNNNSTLVIEGSVVVVGNLNFGGKIIFKGTGSSLMVYGNINNNGGTYEGINIGTPLP